MSITLLPEPAPGALLEKAGWVVKLLPEKMPMCHHACSPAVPAGAADETQFSPQVPPELSGGWTHCTPRGAAASSQPAGRGTLGHQPPGGRCIWPPAGRADSGAHKHIPGQGVSGLKSAAGPLRHLGPGQRVLCSRGLLGGSCSSSSPFTQATPKSIAVGSSAQLLVGCVGGQSMLGAWGGFIKQIWLSLCL